MPGDFHRESLQQVSHRPWPKPDRPWVMTQTWHDLLFAHWPIETPLLRARVPAAFALDLFEGRAWLGIVPFRMTNVAPRCVPALPRISAFAELNVRTYVRVGDKPGVYFFSLDAASRLAVRAARWMYNLPYFTAAMRVASGSGAAGATAITYESRRKGAGAPAELIASYAPNGPAVEARPGSLESFLTERYCLYALDQRGRPYRLEIHHPPWPLQPAEAALARNTMAEAHGLRLPPVAPLLFFARRQDVVTWGPERV